MVSYATLAGPVSMLPVAQCYTEDHDDKHSKAEAARKAVAPGVLSKAYEALQVMNFRNVTSKDIQALLQSPIQVYLCFLMVCSVLYYCLGGSLKNSSAPDLLGFISTIAEGFGLLSLRLKIKGQGSVTGISGMTMSMYALVYCLREWLMLPSSLSAVFMDGWAVEVLQVASLLMVFDVLKSVFITYRSSYQEDLDILNIKFLIPACILLAVLLHPQFSRGSMYSICWTAYLHLDVMALMPQVAMMAHGNGKVEAPVSHFVAATALSRVVDLWFWYYDFDLGPQGYFHGFNYSGWLIVFWHFVNLAIVADFMYYYMKARLSGSTFSEDLTLPTDDMC